MIEDIIYLIIISSSSSHLFDEHHHEIIIIMSLYVINNTILNMNILYSQHYITCISTCPSCIIAVRVNITCLNLFTPT